ncbi:MAG: transcription antitermination factor NusB [Oscillospiraceae bacterium]|nr:transcription antitermination factor NusB [Oscillospiraceae bacterium]
MNRSTAREIAVRLAFEISARECTAEEVLENFFDREHYDSLMEEDSLFSEYPDGDQKDYIETVIRGVGAHNAELDGYVAKYSKGWSFGRISRTALAVMKVSMFETMYMPEIPNGASINEAVEIAKKYDVPETVAFVNGILGSFVREELEGL